MFLPQKLYQLAWGALSVVYHRLKWGSSGQHAKTTPVQYSFNILTIMIGLMSIHNFFKLNARLGFLLEQPAKQPQRSVIVPLTSLLRNSLTRKYL